MIPLIASATVAHLWDLATFLLAVPIVGAEAEIGPIGMIYAAAGPLAAAAWKILCFALAVTALLVARRKRPALALAGAVALLGTGLAGALANTFALQQVLAVLFG